MVDEANLRRGGKLNCCGLVDALLDSALSRLQAGLAIRLSEHILRLDAGDVASIAGNLLAGLLGLLSVLGIRASCGTVASVAGDCGAVVGNEGHFCF